MQTILTMVLAASGADQPAFPQLVNTISWVAVLQLIVLPIVIPVITGLLTKSSWPTFTKRMLTGVLTLITSVGSGLVGAATNGTSLDVGSIIFQWLLTWGIAELVYYGLYKVPVASPSDPASPAPSIATGLAATGVKDSIPARK